MKYLLKGLGVSIALLLAVAVPALAANSHTVNGVYHGLGDGTNSNYYVHPFTEKANSAWKGTALKNASGTVIAQDYGYVSHVHISWDTSPTPECKYKSHHYAQNTAGTAWELNPHDHNHHSPC